MRDVPNKLVAVLTAVAVLVVATTCTASGCLLRTPLARAVGVCHDCCASAAAQHPSDHPGRPPVKGCPACHQTLFAGSSVTQAAGHATLFCAAFDFATVLPSLQPTVDPMSRLERSPDLPPAREPPTLLALSCAFLF
ncbi:MAG TPA: hypothetical protein VLJ39_22200 [Tepidisphaeraceae bacterium]|nr:hypothetical protein [Tepidisphaeraceae bacterium]